MTDKIIALALKDLRLMPRNRGGMFFTFVWPVLVTVLFGFVFGGNDDGEQGKVRIAVVDEDNTDGSRAFLKRLEESFELTPMTRAEAENAVRRGQRTGLHRGQAGLRRGVRAHVLRHARRRSSSASIRRARPRPA